MLLASSKMRAKVNCATESVPYSGTLETGMPRVFAAARSMLLYPVAVAVMKKDKKSQLDELREALKETMKADEKPPEKNEIEEKNSDTAVGAKSRVLKP